jgi:hypothetical protein
MESVHCDDCQTRRFLGIVVSNVVLHAGLAVGRQDKKARWCLGKIRNVLRRPLLFWEELAETPHFLACYYRMCGANRISIMNPITAAMNPEDEKCIPG